MGNRIYMDNAATTPLDPKVLETMLPYFKNKFGNSASRSHSFGWETEEAVEYAREQVAALINASAKEIIFTSGATESNNLAILGAANMYASKGKHVITCVNEHKAVLDPCHHLETQGYDVTFLETDKDGMINLETFEKSIRPDTVLVSLMAANNEIGTLHPIAEIGAICKKHQVLFHTDATQAYGKIPLDVVAMGIDLLSMSAHKMYGPKGCGGLYVRRRNPRVRLTPVVFGGGHERGMRSGTMNVAGIVGFGHAAELCQNELATEAARLKKMRDYLHQTLTSQIDYLELNGHTENRLPGLLNISFAHIEGESMMMGIEDVAVSSGSACTSASLEPSYVLRAMGIGDELAHSSIRFSMGRFTTQAEVDEVILRINKVVQKLRDMSPLYEMVKEGIDLASIQWSAH